MEKKVKYRMLHYYVDTPDPLSGEVRKQQKYAVHGQLLHSDEGTDTETDHYGVSESEFARIEQAHPGAFFSDAELDASASLSVPGASVQGEFEPLGFSQMSAWQLEEWIKTAQPSPEEIKSILEAEPDETRQALASAFLTAENAATGGSPREEIVQLTAATMGAAAAHGPTGSEGLAGTAPGDGDGDTSDEEPDASGKASKAADALAQEHGVDLSEVTGTGYDGLITRPDVQKYLDEKSS